MSLCGGERMSKLWLQGIPIQTTVQKAMPVAFVWNKQHHRVNLILRQWRLDQGWWDEHIWRDYYKLITHTQLLVVIYHDLLNDTWLLQRLYD
jgi:hypothetical protein